MKEHGAQYITKIKYERVRPKERQKSKSLSPTALVNKLIITGKKPSKKTKKICMQLRKIFDPFCLSKLKEMCPDFTDCLKSADFYSISHFMIVYENEIHMGVRPSGPTFIFKIVDYLDNFKQLNGAVYLRPVLPTFEGRSELREVFEGLCEQKSGFKRSLHFHFLEDKIYIRHYATSMADVEDNYRMSLKEIGPRFTLELKRKDEGFFAELKKKNRNNQKMKFNTEIKDF